MSTIGSTTNWSDLIDPLVPEIVDLVVTSWQEIDAPASTAKEDDVTNVLCRRLAQNRTLRNLMFQVRTQVVELDPAVGQDEGRLDIAFIPPVPREGIYFCLECKRLNAVISGKKRSLAAEYVLKGMVRFVTGQYSKRVRHGGMLGYVLSDTVPNAIAGVEESIAANHILLGMAPPGVMAPSTVAVSHPDIRQTEHQRQQELGSFSIHHIFVAA